MNIRMDGNTWRLPVRTHRTPHLNRPGGRLLSEPGKPEEQ
jgi:hypothetical protein